MNVRKAAEVIGCTESNVHHLLQKGILKGERKLFGTVENGGSVKWNVDARSARQYAKTTRKGGFPRGRKRTG